MISVIIPVYNVRPFLEQCVRSVINQTYQDWECILVDDGSTDGSSELCDKLEHEDTRLSVIHQQNNGVSVARNRGLDECKGENVCFIDSDDWVDVDYLQHMVSGMEDSSNDMVVTGAIHEAKTLTAHVPTREETIRMESSYTQSFIANVGLFYGPWSILYKTSIIKEHHIQFPPDLSFGEDTTFVFSYLRHVDNVLLKPVADYHYRIRTQESLSNHHGEEKTFLRYDLWTMRRSFYEEKHMWNSVSQADMYKELWSIVYDGIYSTQTPKAEFLRRLFTIPEISELRIWMQLFSLPYYIRYGIIYRQWFLFYLIRKIKS